MLLETRDTAELLHWVEVREGRQRDRDRDTDRDRVGWRGGPRDEPVGLAAWVG